MGAVDVGWTDERVARLKKLWPSGKSSAEIARELGGGLNRNAVIGKVHRLGLAGKGRASPNPLGRPAKAAPATNGRTLVAKKVSKPMPSLPPERQVVVAAPDPKPEPAPKIKAPASLRLQLQDMSRSQCRWPEGDGPFVFCGHPVHGEGEPYCRPHAMAARGSSGPMRGASGESMARALRKFI